MKEINLDAKDKKLGRLASEIAVLLMGKNEPDYVPYKLASVKVIVNNVSLLDIPKKKLENKIYDSFSGYTSGRKEVTMEKMIEKKGHQEVLKIAVLGMLPKNKLKAEMIKNLIIKD